MVHGHSRSSTTFIESGAVTCNQVFWCCVSMAWPSWLDRCYTQYRAGCRHWGDLWHGCRCRNWNSRTWFLGYRCNQLWCLLSGCGSLWCRSGKLGVSLFQWGWWGLRLSIIAFDTAFPKVASGMAVYGSICSAYLVAVLWKGTNYCSKYPDFPQGFKCGNGLTSIEWCKLFGMLISIEFCMLNSILKTLLNLQGCWVHIADPRQYGGMYLVAVQYLRW